MKELIAEIINELKSIDIYQLNAIKNEQQFEIYIFNKLYSMVKQKTKIYTQCKSFQDGRQIRPDIIIGESDILIELKFDLKNVNDVYRLYYQAIKYSKIANQILIFCVHDPSLKLLKSEIEDLESIEKVKVVHIY